MWHSYIFYLFIFVIKCYVKILNIFHIISYICVLFFFLKLIWIYLIYNLLLFESFSTITIDVLLFASICSIGYIDRYI